MADIQDDLISAAATALDSEARRPADRRQPRRQFDHLAAQARHRNRRLCRWRPASARAPAGRRLRHGALDHPQGARPARAEGAGGAPRRLRHLRQLSGAGAGCDVGRHRSHLAAAAHRGAPRHRALDDAARRTARLGARSRRHRDASSSSSTARRTTRTSSRRLDSEFHLQLARCSRNPLLYRLYQQINTVRNHAQWEQMKQIILSTEKMALYNQQHRAIFEALQAARCRTVLRSSSPGTSKRRARISSAPTASEQ